MAERDDKPSLPSNYVTIVQLQERWLKEQDRKQSEKEEEREKAEKERKGKEPEENRRQQKSIGGGSAVVVNVNRPPFNQNSRNHRPEENRTDKKEVEGESAVVVSRPLPFRRNRWNQRSDHRWNEEESGNYVGESAGVSRRLFHRKGGNQRPEEGRNEDQSGNDFIVNQEEKAGDESKKKRKGKKKYNKSKVGNPRVEEQPEENTSEVVTEKVSENEGIGRQFRRNGVQPSEKEHLAHATAHLEPEPGTGTERKSSEVGTRLPRNGFNRSQKSRVLEQKVSVNQTVEVAENFQHLSINGGKEGNVRMRSPERMNGAKEGNVRAPTGVKGGEWRRYQGGSGRFDAGRRWSRNNGNLVWVKKGDITDSDITGVQSSGKTAMDGEDNRSNQRR